MQDSYSAVGRPFLAPLLKISFSEFSFLSIKRCIPLAGCFGKRGGVLRPEGGVRDDAVRERGGDCNENQPLSVRPAWVQPFSVREKDFMHQARAYFPVSVPPLPVSKNHLAQEPPPGSLVEFSTSPFFARVMGFSWFWWMWDSYSGVQDNISCVLLWVPPSGGTLSVSHSRTYEMKGPGRGSGNQKSHFGPSIGPGGQSGFQEGIHVNLCFQLVVQPGILISRDAASHRAIDYGQARTGESVTSTQGPTPKCGSPWWR